MIVAKRPPAPPRATKVDMPCGEAGAAAPYERAHLPLVAPACAVAANCPFAAAADATQPGRYAALDPSPVPVVLCRSSLAVVYANPAAHRLIAAGCGVAIANGRLAAFATDAQVWLARTVASVVGVGADPDQDGRCARTIAPPDRGPTLLAIIVAQPRADAQCLSAPEAMVILHRPEPRLGPAAAILGAAFGLTDGEIRVLGALATGGALTAVARRLHVGHETVRSHLKSIFAKTGTHRQGELLALVLTLSALPWPRR